MEIRRGSVWLRKEPAQAGSEVEVLGFDNSPSGVLVRYRYPSGQEGVLVGYRFRESFTPVSGDLIYDLLGF